MQNKPVKFLFACLALLIFLTYGKYAVAQENSVDSGLGTVKIESEGVDNRIAPGEFLPISVKLVNFGSQKNVDVTVNYEILDSNNKNIYSENETVAVETTASFVKRVQLPHTMNPGTYTFVTTLNYPYQTAPAVSKFSFVVEAKIAGIFESDFILFSIIFVVVALLAPIFIYFFLGGMQKRPVAFHDYSDKPKDLIIYYEILSDIISQMRLRIGNDALEITKDIPDLQINDKNGVVINIKKDPAKIIALLVSRYEQVSGQRISFGLGQKRN